MGGISKKQVDFFIRQFSVNGFPRGDFCILRIFKSADPFHYISCDDFIICCILEQSKQNIPACVCPAVAAATHDFTQKLDNLPPFQLCYFTFP